MVKKSPSSLSKPVPTRSGFASVESTLPRPTKQNNLLDHPERSPHNRRLHQQAKQIRAEDRPGIARDTVLMPWLIADTVCAEAANYLDSEIPHQYTDALDAKAERCYALGQTKRRSQPRPKKAHSPTEPPARLSPNARFRRLIRSRSDNAGRAALKAFMRHWLFALLTRHHPKLARRLPREYAIGRPLPSPPATANAKRFQTP